MCKARARDYAPRRTSASNYSLTGDHRQSANSTSSDISSSTIPQSQIDNNNRRHGQIQELVPAQPVQEEPPKRYQEAQDPPLPLAQGNRPQVQEEPQACSSRHHARFEGGQGGQARRGIKDDTITSERRWRFSIPL